MSLPKSQTKEKERILKIMPPETMTKLENLINIRMMVWMTKRYQRIQKQEEELIRPWSRETEFKDKGIQEGKPLMSRSLWTMILTMNSNRGDRCISNRMTIKMKKLMKEDILMLSKAEEDFNNGFKSKKPSNTLNLSSESSLGASKGTILIQYTLQL